MIYSSPNYYFNCRHKEVPFIIIGIENDYFSPTIILRMMAVTNKVFYVFICHSHHFFIILVKSDANNDERKDRKQIFKSCSK